MTKKIKNADTISHVWCGQTVEPNEYHTILESSEEKWMHDNQLLIDIANRIAIVNNGVSDFSDIDEAIDYLKDNQPQSVNIISAPEPQPFALPAYRTKRNATASPVTIESNSTHTIDFLLTVERYVSGGCLIVENAEFGDYCTAEIIDIDGVIPAPYRAALCENYPTVATYIEKEFLKVSTPGSVTAGSVTKHEIDTYPLNAKITPGLYLRITYTAVNSGLNRRAVVNYYLTKKL